jgi:hydrogenase expression/formation protein HypE
MSVLQCPVAIFDSAVIKLGHGSGGRMTARLIDEVFLPAMTNDVIREMDDGAIVNADCSTIAVSTDSYVVDPIFFPGGDIGSLCVYGTVNDLSMRGAKPAFLTAAFILEEGTSIDDLRKIMQSFSTACDQAGIKVIAADTKVVNKGCGDKVFINTTGIGYVEFFPAPAVSRAAPGDVIIVSGDIGRHGMAIMSAREGLDLVTTIESDSCSLAGCIQQSMSAGFRPHVLRDITRGGLATVLEEIASASKVGLEVDENAIAVYSEVQAACELLGLDPLYVACEGRFVAVVSADEAQGFLRSVQQQFETATIIGKVVAEHRGTVVLNTGIGGKRIVTRLAGEQLPRIC